MTLGLVISGVFIRMVRVNMLQTLRSDYVEAAHARGVNERHVVYRHVSATPHPGHHDHGPPVLAAAGGAVLTETTFSWPGMAALVDFLNARDYAAVQGIVTVFAVIVIVVSLIIDIINASSTRGCSGTGTMDLGASPRSTSGPRGSTPCALAPANRTARVLVILGLLITLGSWCWRCPTRSRRTGRTSTVK